ncbi:right-handed parallel beta-helix repeat-containing protein [Bradyrhizobium sp. AZCC 2289]|uniref:right-handed parallel beta-helix repeat-containing protein n=1 Tax=Bradyrhizobium sp. AZCC 2289 TaxID=3117026 RepID=UPI002FF21D83
MRRIALFTLLIGFVPFFASAPAHAQATRTWVSGVGDDANPCSRTAPCKTFAGAISKTAAAGEINCLDPGGFGAVTVTKSMTISCDIGTAGVLVAGTNGIVFQGASTDYLYLKGLDIEGLGTGLSGVVFNSGNLLHVEDCSIRHFTGFGVLVKPNTTASFVVTRTTVFDNGNGTTGGGIGVQPTATVEGTIDRLVANRNTFGIFADGTAGGSFNIAVRDSVLNANTQAGFSLSSGAPVTWAMLTRVVVMNSPIGIQAVGGTNQVRVGQSEITGNSTGVSGTVLSFVTNQLNGNGTDGTLTPIGPPALH